MRGDGGGIEMRGKGSVEESMSVCEKVLVFTVYTRTLVLCPHTHYTCTMIPFELYSLRRASEKWLLNF